MRDVAAESLEMWKLVSGFDASRSNFGITSEFLCQYNLHKLTIKAESSLALDPTGVTSLFLLSGMAGEFAKRKTYTADSLVDSRDVVEESIRPLRNLLSALRSAAVSEAMSDFRDEVRRMFVFYGGKDADAFEGMVSDDFEIGMLRYDALSSMQELEVHQFVQGLPDPNGEFRVNRQVFEFWNVNSAIRSTLAQKWSGVTLCLVRDPDALHSFFCFCVKNGETVTMMTDRDRTRHPAQKSMRRSASTQRSFESRAARQWFPYDLLDVELSADQKTLRAKSRDTLVPLDVPGTPLSDLSDLDPHTMVWLGIMFELIRREYGDENRMLGNISYMGEMATRPHALVGEHGHLVKLGSYVPLVLSPVIQEELGEQPWDREPVGHLSWMVERYSPEVPAEVLEVLDDTTHSRALTLVSQDRFRNGYHVRKLDPTSFGKKEDIENDIRWTARYNQMVAINNLAERDFRDTAAEVDNWYQRKLSENADAILDAVSSGSFIMPDVAGGNLIDPFWRIAPREHKIDFRVGYHSPWFLRFSVPSPRGVCPDFGVRASVWSCVHPRCADAVAFLCGVDTCELPWQIRHWLERGPYAGNPILQRLDPVDWVLRDPWMDGFKPAVVISQSKRSVNTRRQKLGLPPLSWGRAEDKE